LQQGVKAKIAQAGLASLLCSGLTLVPGATLGVMLAMWIDGKKLFTADVFAILAFPPIIHGFYMTVLQVYFINMLRIIIGTPTAALKCLFAWFCLIQYV